MAVPKIRDLSGLTDREKITELTRHIAELERYLDWQFANIDETNFTEEFLNGIERT